MTPNKYYYISSGAKNAMRTLRHVVAVPGVHFEDSYMCNLCRDYDEAVQKARSIIGKEAILQGSDFELNGWGEGYTPKSWEREQLAAVNAGVMPFGKHKGAAIADMSESYVKYWVEQSASNTVGQKLIQVFTDIANEKGYFDKWEAEEVEREKAKAEKIAKMSYVGNVGDRLDLFIRCDRTFAFDGYYGTTFLNVCVDREGNKFVYRGSNQWEVGKYYSVAATIKEHAEYKNGERQNIISRPTIKKVIEKESDNV